MCCSYFDAFKCIIQHVISILLPPQIKLDTMILLNSIKKVAEELLKAALNTIQTSKQMHIIMFTLYNSVLMMTE